MPPGMTVGALKVVGESRSAPAGDGYPNAQRLEDFWIDDEVARSGQLFDSISSSSFGEGEASSTPALEATIAQPAPLSNSPTSFATFKTAGSRTTRSDTSRS